MKKLTKVMGNTRGMTLMETMAAIAIFGIVLASILNLSASSINTTKRADFAYTAYNLAKNHLETLRSMPYSTLTSAAETEVLLDDNGVADVDGHFIRSTAVTTNYTGDANLIQLIVSVDYIYRGTQAESPTQLTAVVYQYA